MKEVHVRRLFIHMHHCRDDVFLADKIREIGHSFLKKAFGFLLAHAGKERFVRTDNQAAQMHGILADSLDHEQIVNAVLDGLRVVAGAAQSWLAHWGWTNPAWHTAANPAL